MSEVPETRDSENNWVIASTEELPVETLRAEHSKTHDVQEPDKSSATAQGPETTDIDGSSISKETQASESPHVHVGAAPLQEQVEIPPELPDTVAPELENLIPAQSTSPSRKVDEDLEEVSCSSSEDDVEGLRKRRVRGASTPSTEPSSQISAKEETNGGSGLTLNKCILAALVFVGIGFLVFSGSGYNNEEDSPQTVVTRSVKAGDKQPHVITDIKDWIQQHAADFMGDPGSLEVISGLLDKVAKENQEIRHMQAKLQAQKDELEAMLEVSEGEQLSPGPQHLGLSEENIRLKEALLKEETLHLSVQEELKNLQEKLESIEGKCAESETLGLENAKLQDDLSSTKTQIEGFLAQKETLVAESQMLRQELDKQKVLVASIRRDLENLTTQEINSESESEQQLQIKISEINNNLAMEIQRSEIWEKKYVEHAQKWKEQSAKERGKHGQKEGKWVEKSNHNLNTSKSEREFRKAVHASKHGKEHGKRWLDDDKRESQHEEWRNRKHEHKGEKREHWQEKKNRHWDGEKAPAGMKEFHQVGDKTKKDSEKTKEYRGRDSAHSHHENTEGIKKQKQFHHQHRHQEEEGDRFHPRKGQKDFYENVKKEQQNRQHKEHDEKLQGKDSHHRHHDHNKFWKKLSDHQYRIPEGCSGLEDCAKKDGMDLFNVELKPVQRKQFEDVLQSYLAKVELSNHLPELVPLLNGFFEGPYFTHHKIRFRDFVDDVEDFLEDLAKRETGDDDLVEDFERYVYTSFFGEAATVKKRFPKKETLKYTDTVEDKLRRPSIRNVTKNYKSQNLDNRRHFDHTNEDLQPKAELKPHYNDHKLPHQKDVREIHKPSSTQYKKKEESGFHNDLGSTNRKYTSKSTLMPSKQNYEKNRGTSQHVDNSKKLYYRERKKSGHHHGHRESTENGHNHHQNPKSSNPIYENNGELSPPQSHKSTKLYYRKGKKPNNHHDHNEYFLKDKQKFQQQNYKSSYLEEPTHYHKHERFNLQNRKEEGQHHHKTRFGNLHYEDYAGQRIPSYDHEHHGNEPHFFLTENEEGEFSYQYNHQKCRQKNEKDKFTNHHKSKHYDKHQGHIHQKDYKLSHQKSWNQDGSDKHISEFYVKNENEVDQNNPTYQKHLEEESKTKKWQKEIPSGYAHGHDKKADDRHHRRTEKKHYKEKTPGAWK
ncbi:pre-B-cell leukemia transcription factor-interacting protein 1 isoform X2 [Bombina bombina]|uniref:pre-B-cell leukemia transcription factor-interacting protein 1 isoform X2 n=1 Tax=Bombina bombina TaxID=8345 RepID=UPI00235AA442|nr:pre-B-cell leukemia transcription factor-interacting protein 1 isoform X2 [Bombina bombina]